MRNGGAAQVLMNLGLRLENVRAETLATLQRAEDQGNAAYSPQARIRWATPTDPVSPERQPRSKWSSCLIAALTLLAVGVLLAFAFCWESQQTEMGVKERWERQVADVKSGQQEFLVSPEPKFLDGFVRDQPEVAAKITEHKTSASSNVSDKRYGALKQFPHLAESTSMKFRKGRICSYEDRKEGVHYIALVFKDPPQR